MEGQVIIKTRAVPKSIGGRVFFYFVFSFYEAIMKVLTLLYRWETWEK
jgi:hypothetical protein